MGSVMATFLKHALRLLFAFCSLQLHAQVQFDDLTVGQPLSGSVGVGRFVKPLPLPEGNWLVLSKQKSDYKLLDGKVLPLHLVALKNSDPASPLAALFLAFIPRTAINVSWLKEPCKSSGSKALIDRFDGISTDIIDLCAITFPTRYLLAAPPAGESDNPNFYKFILPEITTHAKELPPQSMLVALFGSRFLDKKVFYNFVIRSDADPWTDDAYRAQLGTWTHATGKSIYQLLDGETTAFTTPPRGDAPVLAKPAPPVAPPPTVTQRKPDPVVPPAPKPAPAIEKRQASPDKAKSEAEAQKLAAQKEAEAQKLAAQKEAERKLAELERTKALCNSSYAGAASEAALRLFIQDFAKDECGQLAAARLKLADIDEKQAAQKRKEDRERQVKMEQVRALIGAVVQFQQTFENCFAPAGSGPCTSANYVFAVRGKILDINTQLNDEIRVEVTDVTLQPVADNPAAQAGAKAAEQAFRKKVLGSKIIRTKADLGLVF
jgi:hypothetical protein